MQMECGQKRRNAPTWVQRGAIAHLPGWGKCTDKAGLKLDVVEWITFPGQVAHEAHQGDADRMMLLRFKYYFLSQECCAPSRKMAWLAKFEICDLAGVKVRGAISSGTDKSSTFSIAHLYRE